MNGRFRKMGKLAGDIAFLNRNNKRRTANGKKQEIKPKRKKRKKDLEKLHENAVEASKGSLTRVYRNGAKGKEIRKGNLPMSKFYKTKLQGEVAKLLNQETTTKSKGVFGSSSKIVHIDLYNKENNLLEEDSVSSEEDVQCPKIISKKEMTTSRKFPWSAMFRYEEFCAIICSENYDDHSTTLRQLTDPIQKVKESLKRLHTNAMRQHFSRPDMNINDYIIDLRNQSSSKTFIDKPASTHIPNIQTESPASPHTSYTSLTADIVEDSHPDSSQKMISEIENKSQPSNIFFPVSKGRPRTVRKTNVDVAKNLHLPCELFDQSVSTTTSLTDDESGVEINCERCAKRDIHNVKYNAKFKKDDKVGFNNSREYIKDAEKEKALSDVEMERFTFIDKSSERNLPHNRAQAEKYFEDLVKDYKSRRTMQETIDRSDTDICTNLSERAMAWKATKSLKHVPTILRRSVCDLTNISDLTYLPERKCNGANFTEASKKHLDFNLNICTSGSSNDGRINVQHVKTNKGLENQHHATKEKRSTSAYQAASFRIPIETNARNKNNKLGTAKAFNRATQFRPQKSVMFSKGKPGKEDPDVPTQLHYNQSSNVTKPVHVDKSATTTHPVNCEMFQDSQHLLLNPKRVHQAEVNINPTQYNESLQNYRDNNQSKPVYFQIIKQPMEARAEQNVTNESLINKPVTTFATCGQTLPSRSMMQQSVVPQNIQFMFRESDSRVYTFNELQNLKLLMLNDSQNVYVSTLNSAHEQKRANECAILQNVNQPTKYLAIEKDLNAQRIPIYFHNNNDKTVSQQYLPCKVVTAVEKQNNDIMFFHEPSSQVILLQGSNLNNGDRQLIDSNYKHLI